MFGPGKLSKARVEWSQKKQGTNTLAYLPEAWVTKEKNTSRTRVGQIFEFTEKMVQSRHGRD